jgi:quercetin dioxygenase-like cupin family protein
MEKLKSDKDLQIVDLKLAAGVNMPRHIATCDACLVVEEGKALLIYAGETRELSPGVVTLIPANEQHMLKIIEDFKAFIILEKDALIKYPGHDDQQIN